MPLPRRRRAAAALAAALMVDAGIALVFQAPAGAAQPREAVAGTEQQTEAVATLEILEDGVSVRREGKDEFKPAKDGQKLRVGDTVQTDATGFAQVNYTDDEQSFTRLDVNTTFTLESLTDDEGNRKIKGSVETGQTWNRTSALTENETFEQEGAGATAAVSGTAFLVSCTDALHCTFTSVVHGITITTIDGEVQPLAPLEACDSTEISEEDANLCAEVDQVTLDAILANSFLIENLFLDGQAGLEGVVIVDEEGNVTFTPTESTPPDEEEEEQLPPDPPVNQAPTVDANPVNVTNADGETPGAEDEGPNTVVSSQDEASVTFIIQASDPEDDEIEIVIVSIPNPSFGRLLVGTTQVTAGSVWAVETEFTFDPVQFEASCGSEPEDFADCFTQGTAETQGSPEDPDQNGGLQSYPSTPFDNGDGTVRWQDSFSFYVREVDNVANTSGTSTVTLEAVEDICNPGAEGSRTADQFVDSCNEDALVAPVVAASSSDPVEVATAVESAPAPSPEVAPEPAPTAENATTTTSADVPVS